MSVSQRESSESSKSLPRKRRSQRLDGQGLATERERRLEVTQGAAGSAVGNLHRQRRARCARSPVMLSLAPRSVGYLRHHGIEAIVLVERVVEGPCGGLERSRAAT